MKLESSAEYYYLALSAFRLLRGCGNNCLRILTICGTNDLAEFGPFRKFNCFPGGQTGSQASWDL